MNITSIKTHLASGVLLGSSPIIILKETEDDLISFTIKKALLDINLLSKEELIVDMNV